MQSLNNKMKKINLFLLKRNQCIFFISGFVVLFLIFSYAFLIFSSVSVAYSLEQGEEKLAKINSDNSILESKFSVTKEEVSENFESRLVLSRNIEYVDSSFEKLVFNK
jgi:hypothetical protein